MIKRANICIILCLGSVVLSGQAEALTGALPDQQAAKTANVKIVSNPQTPRPPNGKPVTVVFAEDLSIGVREGDENYMFGNRVDFNADGEGNLYVTDWDRKRIQKYDPQGKYLLTIGRAGQGPGEFRNPWRPYFDKNEILSVFDQGAHKIVYFEKSGRYLRQVQTPTNLSIYHISSNGFYLGSQSTMQAGPSGEKLAELHGLFNDQFRLVTEMRSEVKEMKSPAGRDEQSMARWLADLMSEMAFRPSVCWVIAPGDAIFYGYPEEYEVRVYSPAGTLSKIIRREYDPAEISQKDKQDFIRVQGDEFLRFLPSQEDPIKKKAVQLIQFPKHKPAFQKLIPMENGWLAVIADSLGSEYTVFDIFDRDGRYIAHFKAGIPSEGLFFKNGKAYALQTTEDGYKFIKRYRLYFEAVQK